MTTKQYDNETFVKNLTSDQLNCLRKALENQQTTSELIDLVKAESQLDFHRKFTTLLDEAMNSQVYKCLSQLGTFDNDVDDHYVSYIDKKFPYMATHVYNYEKLNDGSETNQIERDLIELLKYLIAKYYQQAVSLKTDYYRLHLSLTEDYRVLVRLERIDFDDNEVVRIEEYQFKNITCQKKISIWCREDETLNIQELVTLGTVPITSNLLNDINQLVNQLTKDDWLQLTKPLFNEN